MIGRFRRTSKPDTISALYGTIVAQARLSCFYQDYAVPDTINGRFDLLVLHLVLVIERLNQEESLRPLAQGLFDHFCRDMDDNLREIGIADLKVPKEMRKMGQAFYGRAQAYRDALAASARSAERKSERVLVRDGSRVHVIPVGTIDYVEAQDDYVSIKAAGADQNAYTANDYTNYYTNYYASYYYKNYCKNYYTNYYMNYWISCLF
jgi:hypothetical protein